MSCPTTYNERVPIHHRDGSGIPALRDESSERNSKGWGYGISSPERSRYGQRMHVGVCKITVRIPDNQTIKGKRRVIKSLSSRIRNKFNVSVAEVEDNKAWQLATLGITCASNSARHTDEIIQSVVAFIENSREDLELVAQEQETLSGF